MKTPLTLFACALLLILASCSTNEEALLPTNTNNPDILKDLSHSKWQLLECPDHEFLTINGYTECSYLNYLNFEETKVNITHKNASYIMPHHICYVNGNKMVVSIQDCANTTWKSLFEWEVVSHNNNMLILNITVPNLAPGYNQTFVFEKAS